MKAWEWGCYRERIAVGKILLKWGLRNDYGSFVKNKGQLTTGRMYFAEDLQVFNNYGCKLYMHLFICCSRNR